MEERRVLAKKYRRDGRERRCIDVLRASYHLGRSQRFLLRILARLISIEDFQAELENAQLDQNVPWGEDEIDAVLEKETLSKEEQTFCEMIWQYQPGLPKAFPRSKDPLASPRSPIPKM